jgi:hypothetical protein
MNTSNMRPGLFGAVFLAAMAAGCGAIDVPTSPDTFPVDPGGAAHIRGPQTIALKNAYTAASPRAIAAGKGQTWTVDQKQMTDTAITMLARAVEKQGIKTQGPAEKSITLEVRAQHGFIHQRTMSFVAQANVTIWLVATFGDGSSTTVPMDNNSPMGPQRAFEGALMFAINKLFLDPKFLAYVNTAGPDPLKPAVSAPPKVAIAVAPVAVAVPPVAVAAAPVAVSAVVIPAASAAPNATSSRFPQVGDTWTYELSQRGRGVKPGRQGYVVKVVYSSEAKISDQVSLGGGPPDESDHARGRYLVTQVVSVLSPYLAVFEEPSVGTSLGDIVTSADAGCRGRERCEVSGKVVGRETVRVSAGEFDAIKVTVTQVWRAPSSFQGGLTDTRRELTGWYAPQVKRFVKVTSRPTFGTAPDFELQLVRYQLK